MVGPQDDVRKSDSPARPVPGVSLHAALGAPTVLAVVAGLAAAWVAAGATGLLGHGLRHVLTWVLLGAALLIDRAPVRSVARLWALLGAAVAAVAMTSSWLVPVNILAAAVVLAALSVRHSPAERRPMIAAALAVLVLAVWELARTSAPWLWLAADTASEWMGRAAGLVAGRPLRVGATFAGLDFLILMAALWAGWLAGTPAPRWRRGLVAGAAILGGQLAYLLVLAFACDMQTALTHASEALTKAAAAAPAATPPKAGAEHGGSWLATIWAATAWNLPALGASWLAALRTAIPWNLPALGAGIQLLVAGAILGRPRRPAGVSCGAGVSLAAASGTPAPQPQPQAPPTAAAEPSASLRPAVWLWVATILAAVAIAALGTLSLGRFTLQGKKVVAYEKGFLNWLSPKHGEYGWLSVGMYGNLPTFVESLGGTFVKSPDLSDDDLKDADVLILLYPDKPWQPGQPGQPGQLERIEKFVRGGGSLLVFGEHTVREADGDSRFNDVLKPTAMRVPFDTADFEIGGWLQSYEAMAHPATIGFQDDHTVFGVVIGATVDARWPARPLIVGRWGWADAGDMKGSAYLGNRRYDPGEKLGDLVLAAEQPLGKGTVVAFGDTSSITNGITSASHAFTSRLLAYLASRPGTPAAAWRQVLMLAACCGLIVLLTWRASAWRLCVAGGMLAICLAACTVYAHRAAAVLPDGRGKTPNNLAYIDTTHLGDFSSEASRPNGLEGLDLTLMRNGYLTLNLPDFTPERLERAGLVISVAPRREFTFAERAALKDYVKGGGIFICTAGYDDCDAGRDMLADFGLAVGGKPTPPGADSPEPQPLGWHKTPYLDAGAYRVFVRYWAAWPVGMDPNDARILARGRGDKPVILMRQVGKGKFVLIGDAAFPTVQNLEHHTGEPFEGMRENADFWRWLLTVLRDQPMWVPPPPPTAAAAGRAEGTQTTQTTQGTQPAPAPAPATAPATKPTSAPASAPAAAGKEVRP